MLSTRATAPNANALDSNDATTAEAFYELLRPHVADILQIVQDDVASQLRGLTATFRDHMGSLIKGYDALVQKDLTVIRQQLEPRCLLRPQQSYHDCLRGAERFFHDGGSLIKSDRCMYVILIICI